MQLILSHPLMRNSAILVFANKQDQVRPQHHGCCVSAFSRHVCANVVNTKTRCGLRFATMLRLLCECLGCSMVLCCMPCLLATRSSLLPTLAAPVLSAERAGCPSGHSCRSCPT